MDHYVDLTLLSNPEIAQPHLMGALFSKLHLALVAQRSQSVGISFPAMRPDATWLGDCIRLHGKQTELVNFMANPWLAGVRDHVSATGIMAIPAKIGFRVVSRVQAKSNPERLRRRQMRRHGIDAEQALARLPDAAAERLDLPFVHLRSQSTAQSFRLFIRHGPVVQEPSNGVFGAYGLSASATVPWF